MNKTTESDLIGIGDKVDLMSAIRPGHVNRSGVVEAIKQTDTQTLVRVSGGMMWHPIQLIRKS